MTKFIITILTILQSDSECLTLSENEWQHTPKNNCMCSTGAGAGYGPGAGARYGPGAGARYGLEQEPNMVLEQEPDMVLEQ